MYRKLLLVLWLLIVGLAAGAQQHTADSSGDGRFSLAELLRVVQLYNADGLQCATGTEDGFAPGAGGQSCPPHAADYSPQDWRLSLSELLRLLQLFNNSDYYACGSGEDGYCSGPNPLEGEGDGGIEGVAEGSPEGTIEGEGAPDGEGGTEGTVEGEGEVPVEFLLTYLSETGGSIQGAAVQSVSAGGNGLAVSVQPYTGFEFVEWSDGSTANPRQDTQISAALTVTAIMIHFPDMIPVPAGDFEMGASEIGDDHQKEPTEGPVHTVTLSAYEIGRFEVTNEQYCEFLNWAIDPSRNTLLTSAGEIWNDSGNIYGGENLQWLIWLDEGSDLTNDIRFQGGRFVTRSRSGAPTGTMYPTGNLPMVLVTWHGAVMYANYLSEINGLDPVYSTLTWEADFSKNGFHLPTEAQWERAAAWDGTQHFVYGCSSNTRPTRDQVNIAVPVPGDDVSDPFGFGPSILPTSPVGWFNGINPIYSRNTQSINCVSPVGAYDMSGNVWEMCHDWHMDDYYSTGGPPWVNPIGPVSGMTRVRRGGAWNYYYYLGRTASRLSPFDEPEASTVVGFRLAR